MATEAGTSKLGGTQGCTMSLWAAVHLRCMPRALLAKKKKKKKKKKTNSRKVKFQLNNL